VTRFWRILIELIVAIVLVEASQMQEVIKASPLAAILMGAVAGGMIGVTYARREIAERKLEALELKELNEILDRGLVETSDAADQFRRACDRN